MPYFLALVPEKISLRFVESFNVSELLNLKLFRVSSDVDALIIFGDREKRKPEIIRNQR